MKERILNPESYDIIEIEWIDSTTPGDNGWFELDLDDDDFMLSCYTSGYLVKENEKEVWIINSYHISDSDVRSLGMIAIPKVAIIKREVLKKGK